EGFDDWAQELVETGYLHNHSRMWFASIWIFTLRLPWELGADFFLRHLVDGDPASNTLSWRWVAGLHTKGKTYLARCSNISKYTEGRFRPEYKLSSTAEPLVEALEHPKRPVPAASDLPDADFILLVTEEDGLIGDCLPRPPSSVIGCLATEDRSTQPVGDKAAAFARGALVDAIGRLGHPNALRDGDWGDAVLAETASTGVADVVTSYAPVGPVRSRLDTLSSRLESEGVRLHQIRREYDELAWPHAAKGFFALKQKIPHVLRGLGLGG
ncbi:MAG: FAD-binding domain-containing protein, partial [Pseudomonadota bacterium]